MSPRGPGLPAPHRLVHLAEVDSTNAEAMRRALAGEKPPFWVHADRQTAGRGRSGRAWASLQGNLHASFAIATACPVADAGQLSLVAGVAAIDAIRMAGALGPEAPLRLKWPNDILIGAAKTGGILVESSTMAPLDGMLAVVGVGLNLNAAPADLGRAATNLARHGLALSPHDALCFLAQAMDAWLETWHDGAGFAAIRSAWLDRAGAVGELLSVQACDGPVEGCFVGLDADGALVIAVKDGAERRFTFGDVSLASGSDDVEAQGDDRSL